MKSQITVLTNTVEGKYKKRKERPRIASFNHNVAVIYL